MPLQRKVHRKPVVGGRVVVVKVQSALELAVGAVPILIEAIENSGKRTVRLGRLIVESERFLNFFTSQLRLVGKLIDVG